MVDYSTIVFDESLVLIVDDVESNRDLIVSFLAQFGLNTLTAENGQEAVLLATEAKPDLIIMDIRMPEMDGHEATHILKNTPATAHIPVVALTASTERPDVKEFKASGFSDFLSKPVVLPVLVSSLCKLLPHKKITSKAEESSALIADPSYHLLLTNHEFKETFHSEIKPLLKALSSGLKFSTAQELVTALRDVSRRFDNDSLRQLTNKLDACVTSYDVASLTKEIAILREFMPDDE